MNRPARNTATKNLCVRLHRAHRSEDGNILLFGLGLACVALVLLLGLVQIGSIYSAKRDLAFLADSAALVYSDTEESNAYFEMIEDAHGAQTESRSGAQTESRDSAEETAKAFLVDVSAAKELGGISVEFSDSANGTTVVVTQTKKYTFLSGISDGFTISVTLQGSASARNF